MILLGWFWGDPHIKTLDNANYTFNGLGEYVMLDAQNGTFLLQSRTKLAQGNSTTATIFSAGAAKEENTSTIEVRVKKGGKGYHSHKTHRKQKIVSVNNGPLIVVFGEMHCHNYEKRPYFAEKRSRKNTNVKEEVVDDSKKGTDSGKTTYLRFLICFRWIRNSDRPGRVQWLQRPDKQIC